VRSIERRGRRSRTINADKKHDPDRRPIKTEEKKERLTGSQDEEDREFNPV
jgi:hypothetical protein